MKSPILILLVLAGLWAPAQTILPSQYHLLEYDNTTADWDTVFRKELQYQNGTEWISEEVRYQYISNGNWQDPDRILWTYNSDGQVTKKRVEYYTGNFWQVLTEDNWEFDSLGAMTYHLRLNWSGSSLDTLSYDRNVYVYNSSGEWVSYEGQFWDSFGQQWQPYERTEFTFNANQEWDSQVHLYKSGNNWDTTLYITDYAWADFAAKKLAEYQEHTYSSGQYLSTHKIARSWLPNEGYDEYILYLNPNTQVLDSTDWYHVVFNANGHELEDLHYSYDSQTGAWDLKQLSKTYDQVYNPDGSRAEATQNIYLASPMTYEPRYKWVYSNFITEIAPPQFPEAQISWAPHPAGNSSSLVIKSNHQTAGKLRIVDLQGKLMKTFSLLHAGMESRHEFQLGLPSGLYLYQLDLGKQKVTGKLVVR